MEKISISNQNIKNVFDEAMKLINEGKKPNLLQLQIKHGYEESSARSYMVKRTKTWKKLIKEVDDSEIIDRFIEIVRNGKENTAISAGKELLSLKGRYPKLSKNDKFKKDIKSLLEND